MAATDTPRLIDMQRRQSYDAHPVWRVAAWVVIAGCVAWAAWSIRQEAHR